MKNFIKTSAIFPLFIFVLFSVNLNICTGQWIRMGNGMPSNASVSCIASKDNYIFAGYYSFMVSTNNGNSWIATFSFPNGIWDILVKGEYIFAASKGIWVSTNNGTNWQQTAFNNIDYWSICASGNNIIAGTYQNGIYISSDNGQNWFQEESNNLSIYNLAASNGFVYAGGWLQSNPILYRSTNDGLNWTELEFNNHMQILNIYINGNQVYAGTNYGLYRSTNDGLNWSHIDVASCGVESVVIKDSVIFAGTTVKGVYISRDNGQGWLMRNEGFGFYPSI